MVSFHFGRWGLELRILQKNNNFETCNILVDMKILKIGPQNLIFALWAFNFLWHWIILFDAVIMKPISTTIDKCCNWKIRISYNLHQNFTSEFWKKLQILSIIFRIFKYRPGSYNDRIDKIITSSTTIYITYRPTP